jgi:hypothetical protein
MFQSAGVLLIKLAVERMVDSGTPLNVERLRGNPVSLVSGRQKSFWAGQKADHKSDGEGE